MQSLLDGINPVPKPLNGDGRWWSGHLWSGRSPSCPRYDLPPPGVKPSRAHTGMDIAGKLGSLLVAPWDGWIEWLGWNSSAGYYAVLRHELVEGFVFSRHAHLLSNRLNLKLGAFIAQGDPFAVLGSTGASASPHDHASLTLTPTLPDWHNRHLFLDPEPIYYRGRYEFMQQGHPFPLEVKKVQKRLNTLGCTPKLVVDGDYGPSTAAAVKWYQGEQGIEQHGAADQLVLALLWRGKAA